MSLQKNNTLKYGWTHTVSELLEKARTHVELGKWSTVGANAKNWQDNSKGFWISSFY